MKSVKIDSRDRWEMFVYLSHYNLLHDMQDVIEYSDGVKVVVAHTGYIREDLLYAVDHYVESDGYADMSLREYIDRIFNEQTKT